MLLCRYIGSYHLAAGVCSNAARCALCEVCSTFKWNAHIQIGKRLDKMVKIAIPSVRLGWKIIMSN